MTDIPWRRHKSISGGGPGRRSARLVRTTNRQMPAYRKKVLSDADLADLYAYLKSIPQGPDAKTIPLLNQQ